MPDTTSDNDYLRQAMRKVDGYIDELPEQTQRPEAYSPDANECRKQMTHAQQSMKELDSKRQYIVTELERLNTLLNDTMIAMDAVRALMNSLPDGASGISAGAKLAGSRAY